MLIQGGIKTSIYVEGLAVLTPEEEIIRAGEASPLEVDMLVHTLLARKTEREM